MGLDTGAEVLVARWAREHSLVYRELDSTEIDDAIKAHAKREGRDPTELQIIYYNSILMTWISGDKKQAAHLSRILGPAYLASERNKEWMKKLGPLLENSKESVGIFPGYLHTIGPDGLKTKLEALGWTLKRL